MSESDEVGASAPENSSVQPSKKKDVTIDDFLVGDLVLSMWIPAELSGRVIGKKGAVINNIKTETHASFITTLKPIGTSLWAAVLAAYNAVSDLVNGEVDDVVAEFTIHRSKHSFLIGGDSRKSLEVVKKVSAETNVRIDIPGKESNQNPFKIRSKGSLEGDCTAVFKALLLLAQEMDATQRKGVASSSR